MFVKWDVRHAKLFHRTYEFGVRLPKLLDGCDHRIHDGGRPISARLQHGAQLGAEHVTPRKQEPYRPVSEEWVRLLCLCPLHHFVATDVKDAENGTRTMTERRRGHGRLLVGEHLLVLRRLIGAAKPKVLAAVQTYPLRTICR